MASKDAWDTKYVPANVKTVLDARLPSTTAKIGAKLDELESLLALFRGVMATQGIDPMLFVVYRSFCLACYGAQAKFSGGDFYDKKMAELLAAWALRGGVANTLGAIQFGCFGWRPPAPH